MTVRPLPTTALRALLGVASTVAALALPRCVPAASVEPVLTYRNDALTVRLDAVPIDEVVELFARETGAEVLGEPADLRMVTKRFDAVPLPEALHRLLGAENFVMRYGEDGRLVAVELLGAPRPRSVSRTKRTPRPAHAVARRLLVTRAATGLDGDLRAAIGAPQAPLPRLLDVALEHESAAVRRLATRKLVQFVEQDARLRETTLATLRETDDRTLMDLVSRRGAERAREFFAAVAADASDGYVRARAWRLMRAVGRGTTAAQRSTAEIVAAGTPGA